MKRGLARQGTLTRIWAERGTRPRAPRDTRYIWSYIFGAVCPERAEAAALIMPHADTQAMSAHLAEIAKTVASGAHALLILDGAGWHGSAELEVPDNITLLKLPPYSPELNPMENVWAYLRANKLPYPSSTIMSRSLTGVAKHGTSLQTTKPQSRQSLPDNGPKRSTTRAVGIMYSVGIIEEIEAVGKSPRTITSTMPWSEETGMIYSGSSLPSSSRKTLRPIFSGG